MIKTNNGYEYCICINRTNREYHTTRHISYDYDTENYGFADSRESIERELNHRSFSVDFLFNI